MKLSHPLIILTFTYAMARKTRQEFIEQAQRGHGDQFDYSEVEYVNTHTPVKIRCKQCGLVFLQEPSSHLAGRGCPKCSKRQTHKRVNQELYIARAREVHGDKYDYSKTVYENMHSKVLIICPCHGEFYQRAQSHLLGSGCPMCKYDAHMDRIRKMMEQIEQGEGTNDPNNVEIAKLP